MMREVMMSRMSSTEYAGWRAFDMIEPFGDYRADIRTGIIASTVFNFGGTAAPKAKDRLKPIDFMPFARGPEDDGKPVLLKDPKAQAALLRSTIFASHVSGFKG